MILEQINFKIRKVYGRFLIGIFKRENQTKLIELGGKDYQELKSILKLSPADYQFEIESDFLMDNFVVKYACTHKSFYWDRFEKQNFVTHKDHDDITQICADLQLTIRNCSQET